MPSKLETEMLKITKLRQAQNEPRGEYLLRLLEAGQALTKPEWNKLSAEAQRWYNDGVIAYGAHSSVADIKDFPDLPPPAVERVALKPRPVESEPEPVDETVDESQPEEGEVEEEEAAEEEEEEPEGELEEGPQEPVDDEFEEDVAAVEEPEPVQAAPKPAPKPTKAPPKPVKPPPKPAPKGKVSAKPPAKQPAKPLVSKPPKPAPPGASTMIKRMLLKNINVTNAELMEKLHEEGISVTPISVSTIRSDFRHSIRVLHEAGIALEVSSP